MKGAVKQFGSEYLRLALLAVACLVATAVVADAANGQSEENRGADRERRGEAPASERSKAERPGTTGKEKARLVIHGGTSSNERGDLTPREEAQYRATLGEALQSGNEILESGGSSVDAVEEAIRVMEDSPLFNAGEGAVFNEDAEHQLDASIMDGQTLESGGVAAIENVKNPISAARLVMEESPHVLLSGEGADDFALERGLETVTQDYFYTKQRWKDLRDAKREEEADEDNKGTVGAVALDEDGDLAAGTSTGGLTNKAVGRIGDSPIVGAGNYADGTVAASGTGTGEYYIRANATREVSALMEYRNMRVEKASQAALDRVVEVGEPGSNGIIALDKEGNFATPFTEGMNRGYVTDSGEVMVELYPKKKQADNQQAATTMPETGGVSPMMLLLAGAALILGSIGSFALRRRKV